MNPSQAWTAARWLLLPAACIGAWWIAIFLGVYGALACRRAVDPYSFNWTHVAASSIELLTPGISATFVLTAAYFTAPSAKRAVIWIVLVLGVCTAAWFAYSLDAWPEFLAAASAGIVTTFLLAGFDLRRPAAARPR